jgi:hypothetical protein
MVMGNKGTFSITNGFFLHAAILNVLDPKYQSENSPKKKSKKRSKIKKLPIERISSMSFQEEMTFRGVGPM